MTDFMDWLRGTIGTPQPNDLAAQGANAAVAPLPPAAPPVSVPATPPAPVAGDLPIGPGALGGLPNIAGMLANIKNAPPTAAQSAPVDAPPSAPAPVAPVPPQGDNLPPLPPSQEVAANAPPATAAPAPLVPAPDAGPAAPSDTPAGKSLLERIIGSSDASTKDASGLTDADRHATGFSALTKLGFGIMAASMPQNPAQRAQIIGQLGNIPAGVLKERAAMIGEQAQAQRVQLGQQQLDAKKAGIEYLKSPEFQNSIKSYPTQMQGAVKAFAAAGDLASIAKLQQNLMPKLSGNTIYNPATGQAVNTITGVATGGGSAPAPSGAAPAAGGPAPGDPETKAAGYIQQNVPPQFQQTVQDIVNGDAKLPGVTDRNGIGLQLTTWARNAAAASGKALDQTTYDLRDKAKKDFAPNGVTGSQLVSMNTFLQHTNDLQKAAGNLDNTSLPIWNKIKNDYNSAIGGSAQDRFNQVRGLATKELDTLVSKGHATIAETSSIRENLNAAKSPEQMQAVIDEMASMAKARVQSQTQQAQNALGKKGFATIEEQLQNPEGAKAIADIEANPIKGSDRHKAYTAIRQQFGLPADADVAHYEYRKLPDGTVQRKKK